MEIRSSIRSNDGRLCGLPSLLQINVDERLVFYLAGLAGAETGAGLAPWRTECEVVPVRA